MEIFVSQLPETVKEYQLKRIFEKYGKVISCKLVFDHITRKSKGFGFVQMPDADQAKHAIEELDGAEVDDSAISVRFAKPKENMQKTGAKSSPKSKPAFEKPKKKERQNFSGKKEDKNTARKEPKPLGMPKNLKRPE